MAEYTVVEGAGVSHDSGGALTVPVPAGTLTGKLLLVIGAVRDYAGATITTAPSGFTLLESYTALTNPSVWIYGKIGTSSESSVTFDTSTGVSQAAVMISVESTTGWPAIGSIKAGASKGDYNHGSGLLSYIAHTMITSGNFGLQVGKKASVNGTNTIAVTSGWQSAGRALENNTSNTLNLGAQGKKITANIPNAGEAITGEATSSVAGCITIELIPAVATASIDSVGKLTPGATVAVTYSGYAAVPNSENSTLGTVPITVSDATLSGCNIVIPPHSEFEFGGDMAALNYYVNTALVLGNGSETDSITVQVELDYTDQFAAKIAGTLVYPVDTYNGGLTIADGDWIYQSSTPARAFNPFPELNDFSAIDDFFDAHVKWFDNSAGSWSTVKTWSYPAETPPGGGTLEITGGQLSVKPPGTLVPGSYDLSEYGDIDWVHTARTAHTVFDTMSGGTEIGAPSNIGTPAWTRNTDGDATSDPLLSWTNGAELLSYAGDRFTEYTQVVGAGKRWVISPAGALRKIYLWVGTFQGAGRITVTFSDASAGPLSYDFSSLAGIYETELVEILARPAGGAATIQIDLTHVSGFSTGWAALAVGLATTSGEYSLTSVDKTLAPGQTERMTIVGGPFAGPITAAYAVYGEFSIPISWDVITPTEVDVTMPAQTDLDEGGVAERLRKYANFAIRLEAGAENAETPNDNQLIATIPENYGTAAAPPWLLAVANAQQGDLVEMIKISGGAITFDPTTFGIVTEARATIEIYCYSISTAKWLKKRRVALYPGKAMKTLRREILSIYFMSGEKRDIVKGYVMQDGVRKEIF